MKAFKILALCLLFVFLLAGGVYSSDQFIEFTKIFDNVTVSAGSYVDSSIIRLDGTRPDGYFVFCPEVSATGDPTLKFELLISYTDTKDSSFLEPTGVSDIATGFTKTSGSGSNGKDCFSVDFNGIFGKYFKIRATETGGADDATLTGYLGRQ